MALQENQKVGATTRLQNSFYFGTLRALAQAVTTPTRSLPDGGGTVKEAVIALQMPELTDQRQAEGIEG